MRISESPMSDRTAPEPPEIPRDFEKEYTLKQLSLLDPCSRPRSITPSGFRDPAPESSDLPKPSFQHCTYYKLPPEIRRFILRLAFGDQRLHMDLSYDHSDMSSGRVDNHCGIVNTDFEYVVKRVLDHTKPRSWHWWGSVCHRLPPDLDITRVGPMTNGGPDGPWADTCRIGNAEHC
ncbi:hypothetical protein FBEOM_8707 [Fusarium beomiforme]|uniref:Uncharacterized protein n=1 Tax=Fusarium beomiforme TaxID=44412 RepID=A0A9P5AES3_9HYPO|nr:hypothetical protein FBEOM_8707 [Fusarium beomiforme]